MANGRIEVVFTANTGVEQPTLSTPSNATEQEKKLGVNEENKSGSKISSSALNAAIIGMGKTFISTGISSYGDLTGNYLMQNQIDNMVQLSSVALMATQFPVGTIASVASLSVNAFKTYISNDNKNREIELLKQRSGNEANNNGIRGQN